MQVQQQSWPAWKKITFRFFFIYLALFTAPWTWLDAIPGISYITQYYYQATDWLVNIANDYLFHVRPLLVPLNGSGDTSYGWTQLWLYLTLSVIGCVIWSLVDKRTSYNLADYWMRTFLRYYIALVSLSYGIIKLFALQMPFPSLSQLSTPLGDFLPMRFSWMFVGYSTPYQIFAGAMEVLVGLLLFNRKTVTAGLLVGAGVFTHVVVLNLCFDIPVKIYSIQLLIGCIFLFLYDAPRLTQFFVMNNAITATQLYEITIQKRWMKIGRWVLKAVFAILFIAMPLFQSWNRYQDDASTPLPKPFYGVYNVDAFIINGDSLPITAYDTIRWKDIIFEKGGFGSVNAQDTLFRQRYRRGYFNFTTDTVSHTIVIKKSFNDSIPLFTMRYDKPMGDAINLRAKFKNDSLKLTIRKSNRHFQLAEKQFHWLSEYNR
jgi:hypothetical protein